MKLLSVSVSLPKIVIINGGPVPTGIYKEPIARPVKLLKLGLEGDGQADLTVHGGEDMAVYSYPFEHYGHWMRVLDREPLAHGTFGENFTVSGLLETEVCIGDIFRIGSAEVQVTMPRVPCFKLGHKLGQPTIIKPFLQSGFSGFYQRVLVEGTVTPGDDIKLLHRDEHGVSVRACLGMQKLGEGTESLLSHALEIESLAASLRHELSLRLAHLRS